MRTSKEQNANINSPQTIDIIEFVNFFLRKFEKNVDKAFFICYKGIKNRGYSACVILMIFSNTDWLKRIHGESIEQD